MIDPLSYSKFKYGCVTSTRLFASQMAQLVHQSYSVESDVVIASSAFLSVPNAAALMTNEMFQCFPENYFSRTYLKRDRVFPYDYACLEQNQRTKSMKKISLAFEKEQIANKTLIVIDDCFVTGAHERNIIHHLFGCPKEMIFLYLINMGRSFSATIEDEMNSAYVKELFDLLPFMKDPGYEINSRTLKFILNAPFDDFVGFLSCITSKHTAEIYRKAISEGYQSMSEAYLKKLDFMSQSIAEFKKIF